MLAALLAVLEPSTATLPELAKALFDAVMSGQWFLAASVALVLLVMGLRSLPWAPLKTDAGGVLLNFGTSLGLALATVAVAGVAFTGPVFWTAFNLAATGAGLYTLAKKLAWPLLLKIPFVAALFPPKADGPALVTAAQKAGLAAAVVAKAPTSDEIANGR